MKLKLLIAFLSLPFFGKAQLQLSTKQYPLDTVKCVMLVCDTSLQEYNNYNCIGCQHSGYNPMVTWQTGYFYYTGVAHVAYLNENKKPLSKNIIVWMSKSFEVNEKLK